MDLDVEELLNGLDEFKPEDKTLESIQSVYRRLMDLYGPRMPTDLRLPPEQYLKCVDLIQNQLFDTESHKNCLSRLSEEIGKDVAIKIGVHLLQAPQLAPADFDEVKSLHSKLTEMIYNRNYEIDEFTEKATKKCPNLSALISPGIVARLLVPQLGTNFSEKLLNFSKSQPSNFVNVDTSPLAADPLISNAPLRLRKPALRILAGKTLLASRVDSLSDKKDCTQGLKWRRDVEKKIDKLLAPPPSVQQRALPKPQNKLKQRRGGLRVRKQKQRKAPSELQERQNIMEFGAGKED